MSELEITFLGTGTSTGIPMIGCGCDVCRSEDSRDKRDRCAIYVESPDRSWVVDTGPDFRHQCLREDITELDAALFTHAHSDHILGFDDLRRFTLGIDDSIPVYANAHCLGMLKTIFHFAFDGQNRYPSYLKPVPHPIDGPFSLGDTVVTPLPVEHGKVETNGFLFARNHKTLAYIPDCKVPLPETLEVLDSPDVLIIDSLRYSLHPTHMNVAEATAFSKRIGAKRTWLTHFQCEISHAKIEEELPPEIRPAYDGLKITL